MNLGGTPWSHYKIAVFPKVLAGVDEVLFLRVDAHQDESGKRRHYLCLRQYGVIKEKGRGVISMAKAIKLARLPMHKEIFEAACAEARPPLRFSRPANDIKGANESEIGILFFDEKEQPPARVLQEWPAVHRALIQRLNKLTCSHGDRDS